MMLVFWGILMFLPGLVGLLRRSVSALSLLAKPASPTTSSFHCRMQSKKLYASLSINLEPANINSQAHVPY